MTNKEFMQKLVDDGWAVEQKYNRNDVELISKALEFGKYITVDFVNSGTELRYDGTYLYRHDNDPLNDDTKPYFELPNVNTYEKVVQLYELLSGGA